MKDLLKIKQQIKAKTPKFRRADSHKKIKLNKGKWRKPKGLQNKMRLNLRGYARTVKVGYGTPSELRGVQRDGKKPVLVSTIEELKKLTKDNKAIIASGVGARKKIILIEEAKKMKIEVANFKDADKYVEDAKKKLSDKRKEQETKKEERTKKKETAEKKKEKSVEEKVSEEDKSGSKASDKQKEDKKEKDKLLIQKE